jgi:hypothetical protein
MTLKPGDKVWYRLSRGGEFQRDIEAQVLREPTPEGRLVVLIKPIDGVGMASRSVLVTNVRPR